MKQITIFILFFLYFFSIHAQDTIKLKNTKVLHAYKTDSIHADTTYCAKLSGINSIHSGNGKVDMLESQNPRKLFPLGINYGFIVATAGGNSTGFNYSLIELTDLFKAFSGNIDYLITPKISTEVSLLVTNESYLFSLGGKYWLANKRSKSGFSPFLGLFYTNYLLEIGYYHTDDIQKWSSFTFAQVPIGISYITKFGLQTTLQLDNFIRFDFNRLSMLNLIELRIGWRFKTGKKGY